METVGQLHSLLQDIPEDRPGDFPASFGESAPVDRHCIRPHSTASCRTEEIPGLDVHPLALPACDERQDKRDESGQWQFPISGKVFGGLFEVGVELFGDEI